MQGPALRAIAPTPFVTLQDGGRRGWRRFGLSGAGAMDRMSLAIANSLVGNRASEAALEFAYAGGGIGKGADITLFVDGKEVGKGRVERSHGYLFSMDETTEIGCDNGEPVSTDYGPRDNGFNGEVKWVQIDIDAAAADIDHLIGAEERFQLAMARQ